MNYKKIITITLLLTLIATLSISYVSAEKFEYSCQGGTVEHKANYTKTFIKKVNTGELVKKNGAYYKKRYYLYEFTELACYHESHKNDWSQGKGYTKQFQSISDPRGAKYDKYDLVKVKKSDRTENVKVTSSSSFSQTQYKDTIKTSSTNFVITHTMKAVKKFVNPDSAFVGYVTVKSKNPKIKIKSLLVKQGNGFKGFKWKTYNINSNKKTVKLGKNTRAMIHMEGVKGYILSFKVKY